MKKTILLAAAALFVMSTNAQDIVERTNFSSNWSIGVTGGVTTPLRNHPFFDHMRGAVGLDLHKQVSNVFGLGAEGSFAVNTSSWNHLGYRSSTVFDSSYVGAYGSINLTELFMGFSCEPRCFGLDLIAGAGWGHDYWNTSRGYDSNYFATKLGLNFNFAVSEKVALSLRPAIVWQMTGTAGTTGNTSCKYDANYATFNLAVGVTYKFGTPGFKCVTCPPDLSAEVAALNARINELRGQLDDATAQAAANLAQAQSLSAQLDECLARPVQVVTEPAVNTLKSVRYVYFKIGSSAVTSDQLPNVEMIANYLKSHPEATVEVKGYASKDGNLDSNIKLANARAESVRNSLINKYGIAAKRIKAEGQGIGEMFDEESWNRVSICTIED